ncbi:MAG: HAD-IB family phosphatase [Rickettsiales bacterium]|jgi:HAD superfamily phosphoserine phosphatase-like hydrolase|nr:HAD-IB family phosphatase [Rickettsiales bacterium]
MNNIIFDFDSTIVENESFNDLLKIALKGDKEKSKQVDEIVNKSMNGIISVKESLEFRFKIATPNKEQIKEVVNSAKIVYGMQALIKDLLKESNVYIVSGGFKEMIIPVAEILGISSNNVYANEFIYNKDNVISVKESVLTEQQGKAKIIKSLNIKTKKIMVGDGWTDLETYLYGAVDEFIAFFGVVKREKVDKEAKLKANNVDELRKILLKGEKNEI